MTGLGVITPAGNSPGDAWQTMLSGQSLARPIRSFDASELPIRFACEVDDFDTEGFLGAKETRRMARATQLGMVAALQAVLSAGEPRVDVDRRAIVVGTGFGSLGTWEEQYNVYASRGLKALSPFGVPMMMPCATAVQLAIRLGWSGPNLSVTPACAAGACAIGEGVRMIRDGTADVVLAGGVESLITSAVMSAFARTGSLSGRNEDPAAASRPFDVNRDGFVMGEGAAFIVLERLDLAEARGATVVGLVIGYANTCDAYHLTAPSPRGREQRAAWPSHCRMPGSSQTTFAMSTRTAPPPR